MHSLKRSPISVLMSVFNGEAFLAQAIESVLNQTWNQFEFLIIDDGSSDRSAAIISDYAQRDSRIRAVRHDNRGRAESLNIGMHLASGQFIARMDADDIALPRRLELQQDFLMNNPSVGVVGGAYELVDRGEQIIRTMRPPTKDSEIKALMLRSNPMCHPSVVMRKDVALSVGGYRPLFMDADDYDLFLRMGELSALANVSEPVLKYRLHPSQVSVRNLTHQTYCVLAARHAWAIRKSGGADPLCGIREITLQVLGDLGVDHSEIQVSLAQAYAYWIDIFRTHDSDESLRLVDRLLELPRTHPLAKQLVVEALMKATAIQVQRHVPLKAFAAAARAVAIEPAVTKRLVGWPIRWLSRMFPG